MSDREKLIELLNNAGEMLAVDEAVATELSGCESGWIKDKIGFIADYLISNGVTVGVDTKPLKQYLAQIDEYAGLKLKFLVFKADTGERIENCFVLRPDKDRAAVEALRAYAEATDNKTLAEDIYNWVGNGVTLQKWISVSERLPEPNEDGSVNAVLVTNGFVIHMAYFNNKNWWFCESGQAAELMFYVVTHWMPLPEPPKECE